MNMKDKLATDMAIIPESNENLPMPVPKAPKNEKKQKRQRRDRRGQTLIKKAFEISQLSNADVFLGIRFRDTGKMKTFCADRTRVWSLCVTPGMKLRLLYCKANCGLTT